MTLTVHVPPTAQIAADPQTIMDGEEINLTWTTTHAEAVTITPDIGTVAASGSATVAPSQTTSYTIAASGPGGSANHAALVTVNHSPIAEIAVNPGAINSGETAALSWNTTYADTVTISPDIGSSALSGSLEVSPSQSTVYSITATGPGGTTSSEVKLTLNSPTPTVSISSSSQIITKGESITLTWTATDADTCSIEPNIGSVPVSGTMVVTPDQDTTYTISALGQGGEAEAGVTIKVNDLSGGPVVTLEPAQISIAAGESATLNWTTVGAQSAHFDNGLGAVPLSGSIMVSPTRTTIYTLTASGATGSASARALVYVVGNPQPQSKGSFGEIYNDLIPPDATVEAYDERRFSIMTGMVNDIGDTAIEGVMVSILGHAEYGTAYTDSEGRFAIPVEGGGPFVVVYRKEGLISVQRQVDVLWNDVAVADTIQMLIEDTAATTIIFDGNPDTVITHQSTPYTDEFGTRATTLVFTGDNMTYAVDEKGTDLQQLATITTRATEYATLESMPAQLPPTSAYTYCSELSVDGVKRVRFEQPVIMWVENFLHFPVGEVVPVGYYDRDKGVWIPSDNGVVVQLMDTNGDGVVDALDATGDGLADDLDNDGNLTDEVSGLTDNTRYAPGASYWRVQVTHFSPWDCNWPFSPPPDAIWPDPTLAADYSVEDCRRWPNPEVRVHARIVDKEIPIPGTDMALHYASNRAEGYSVVFEIEASHDTVPASLQSIQVQLKIGGQVMTRGWEAAMTNKSATITWDATNFRGNSVHKSSRASVMVGYVYNGNYNRAFSAARAFAMPGAGVIEGDRTRSRVTLWNESQIDVVTAPRWQKDIAAGWSLNNHHLAINSDKPKLIKGDGALLQRFTSNYAYSYLGISGMIFKVAGGNDWGAGGDGGPALEAQLRDPFAICFNPAGNICIFDQGSMNVRKIDSEGIISTFADLSQLYWPRDMAIDAQCNIFIADEYANAVFKIDSNGTLTTFAGSSSGGYGGYGGYGGSDSGDGGPATEAILSSPSSVAVDRYGNVFVAERNSCLVRKVDAGGIISTVIGTGTMGNSGEGGPAVEAQIQRSENIFVDAAGNLYITTNESTEVPTNRVQKVDTQGIIRTIYTDYSYFNDLTVDPLGNIYIVVNGRQIKKILPDGTAMIIAGNGDLYSESIADGQAATQVALPTLYTVAIGPDGLLYAGGSQYVFKIFEPTSMILSATLQEPVFADPSGFGYVISEPSLHSRTIDLRTGRDIYAFQYDSKYNLIGITDAFGQQTQIQRDASDVPVEIDSPGGLHTVLSVNENNHLTSVTLPGDRRYTFEYTQSGLLTKVIEPTGAAITYSYDQYGRLEKLRDQENIEWSYTKSGNIGGELITRVNSPEGNRITYRDEIQSGYLKSSAITESNGARLQYERVESEVAGEPTIRKTLQCDTQLEFKYGYDEKYNYEYLKEAIEQTPSHLTRTFQFDTLYEDTNGDGVADIISDRVSINGFTPATVTQDVAAGTRTATTPESRLAVTAYNTDTLRLQSISVPGYYDTFWNYDGRGRLTSIQTHTRQRSFAYNAQGFLASVTEMPERLTSYTYDSAGRVLTMTHPDASQLGFNYNANGDMTVITDPLGAHTLTYSKDGLTSGYTAPLSGSYSYLYDKDRHLVQIDFPSGKHIYSFYDQGVLQRIHTPEGDIDFGYAPACDNKVDSISKSGESISYGFDGILLDAETLSGTLNQNLDFEYDESFNVSAFTYAGETQIYTYDLDGLLTGAGPFVIGRNLQNGLPETVIGSGLNMTRGFDRFGEVESQSMAVNGQNAMSWTLSWEDSGQISNRTESVGGVAAAHGYAYDALGRLVTVTKDGALVASYGYDTNGMRISETNTQRGIIDRSFNYSPEHQVLNAGSVSYGYDADGFLSTRNDGSSVTTYSYSSRGELQSVLLPDGRQIGYLHDPLGRRIAKLVDGTTVEKYLWEADTLLAVFDGSDNLVNRFVYADGRLPVSMTHRGVTYFLAYDPAGSLRMVIDASGNPVKRIDYDAFGYIVADSNPAFALPLGFAGGLYDMDTGLVRIGRRDFDPDIGRWTAKDPGLFSNGDTDLYGYVLNNPVNFVDPYGENPVLAWVVGGAISGAIGGAAGGAIVGAITGGVDGAVSGFVSGAIIGAGVGVITGPVGGFTVGSVVAGIATGVLGELSGPSITEEGPGWDPDCP